MLVLLFQSLRQGIEVDTPGDVRATTLSNKSSSHILSESSAVKLSASKAPPKSKGKSSRFRLSHLAPVLCPVTPHGNQ